MGRVSRVVWGRVQGSRRGPRKEEAESVSEPVVRAESGRRMSVRKERRARRRRREGRAEQ